jgi:anti-sigma B factor antagonist
MPMDVKTRSAGSVDILELAGRFDAYIAPRVAEWLGQVSATAPANVVINLAGVRFMDSTALGTLVQGMKRCREHDGDVHLSGLQQPVQVIFELTRLDRVFETFSTEEQAVRAFSG